jgi:hypothetical protein
MKTQCIFCLAVSIIISILIGLPTYFLGYSEETGPYIGSRYTSVLAKIIDYNIVVAAEYTCYSTLLYDYNAKLHTCDILSLSRDNYDTVIKDCNYKYKINSTMKIVINKETFECFTNSRLRNMSIVGVFFLTLAGFLILFLMVFSCFICFLRDY